MINPSLTMINKNLFRFTESHNLADSADSYRILNDDLQHSRPKLFHEIEAFCHLGFVF